MKNAVLTQWLTQPDGLATRLGAVRKSTGMSGAELAGRLGWSESKISRIQSGRTKPSADDVRAWLAACSATHLLEELNGLLEQAAARHIPWNQRLARGHSGIQTAYNELVAQSDKVIMVEMAAIPGPLQTRSYTIAMLSSFSDLWPEHPADIEEGVRLRQQRAATPEGGPELEAIVSEAALLGAPCSAEEMDVQLDHLITAMDFDSVNLRILKLSSGMTVVPVNSFNWYVLTDGQDLVLVETFSGETEVWADDVDSYRRSLEWIRSASVGDDEARKMINRARLRLEV